MLLLLFLSSSSFLSRQAGVAARGARAEAAMPLAARQRGGAAQGPRRGLEGIGAEVAVRQVEDDWEGRKEGGPVVAFFVLLCRPHNVEEVPGSVGRVIALDPVEEGAGARVEVQEGGVVADPRRGGAGVVAGGGRLGEDDVDVEARAEARRRRVPRGAPGVPGLAGGARQGEGGELGIEGYRRLFSFLGAALPPFAPLPAALLAGFRARRRRPVQEPPACRLLRRPPWPSLAALLAGPPVRRVVDRQEAPPGVERVDVRDHRRQLRSAGVVAAEGALEGRDEAVAVAREGFVLALRLEAERPGSRAFAHRATVLAGLPRDDAPGRSEPHAEEPVLRVPPLGGSARPDLLGQGLGSSLLLGDGQRPVAREGRFPRGEGLHGPISSDLVVVEIVVVVASAVRFAERPTGVVVLEEGLTPGDALGLQSVVEGREERLDRQRAPLPAPSFALRQFRRRRSPSRRRRASPRSKEGVVVFVVEVEGEGEVVGDDVGEVVLDDGGAVAGAAPSVRDEDEVEPQCEGVGRVVADGRRDRPSAEVDVVDDAGISEERRLPLLFFFWQQEEFFHGLVEGFPRFEELPL
mmetsp:Transcript_17145/g.55707  ORF Transcript_17145/g.55707 Transcript_17145/m.55707 type:complete len:578 (+) Transcript_17145:124-1857(+)